MLWLRLEGQGMGSSTGGAGGVIEGRKGGRGFSVYPVKATVPDSSSHCRPAGCGPSQQWESSNGTKGKWSWLCDCSSSQADTWMTGRHAVFRVDLESQGHTALLLLGDGPRGRMSCVFVCCRWGDTKWWQNRLPAISVLERSPGDSAVTKFNYTTLSPHHPGKGLLLGRYLLLRKEEHGLGQVQQLAHNYAAGKWQSQMNDPQFRWFSCRCHRWLFLFVCNYITSFFFSN